jgi:mono/diheme cytochrome c family protein
MKRLSRLGLAVVTGAVLASIPVLHAAETFPASVVEQGRYLATASDCTACHTAPAGKPMAGGLAIASPVGTIISTNITPSKSSGIGGYTEAQFADAVRRGVRPDGANLYPAMPYTAYAVLTDSDIHALYAYFMQAVAPVDQPTAETSLPFPMNIRLSMKIWNALFLTAGPRPDDTQHSAQWNRGRYLVDGPAHCSTCHTPRGIMMQEQTSQAMAGAQVGPWFAPNITPAQSSGIGSWTQDELVAYLKTGHLTGKAQAAGSMAEAITHSFQHLTGDDLQAIATYIRALPPIGDTTGTQTRFNQGQPADDLISFRGKGFTQGMQGDSEGAQIFSANCASCHGASGQGAGGGYYPSLFHNSATAGPNATNLLATILYGVDRDTTAGHIFMPPFGSQPNALTALTDDQVAHLANYILKSYGNGQVSVAAADVAIIRQGGPRSNLVTLARIGMAAGAVIVVLILLALVIRRRAAHA